jgi:hypothetical protein
MIEQAAADVVFTREALDERLAEIQAREEAVRADIASLMESGDAAELALFQARRRLELATSDTDIDRAQEQMLTREAELTAARKGIEYLHQAAGLAGAARIIYERRYALLQGEEGALWPTWLRETQSLIRDMAEESAFAQAELDALRSMQLDKPFKVGDFVIAGETLGVVEHIGVKTTRIRSLSGEMVVMSNTNLLNSTVRNYKHMRERRVVFKLGVVYQTTPDQLERIPQIIEEIIRDQPRTRFDRAHFAEYGDFSLDFEVVYYVIGSDFNLYMDIQQAINLAIYRKFQEEGIQFAYPTQELIVRRDPPQAAPTAALGS